MHSGMRLLFLALLSAGTYGVAHAECDLNGTAYSNVGDLIKAADPNTTTSIYCSSVIFGSIPTEVGLLTALTQLYVGSNTESSGVNGTVPTEIALIPNLVEL